MWRLDFVTPRICRILVICCWGATICCQKSSPGHVGSNLRQDTKTSLKTSQSEQNSIPATSDLEKYLSNVAALWSKYESSSIDSYPIRRDLEASIATSKTQISTLVQQSGVNERPKLDQFGQVSMEDSQRQMEKVKWLIGQLEKLKSDPNGALEQIRAAEDDQSNALRGITEQILGLAKPNGSEQLAGALASHFEVFKRVPDSVSLEKASDSVQYVRSIRAINRAMDVIAKAAGISIQPISEHGIVLPPSRVSILELDQMNKELIQSMKAFTSNEQEFGSLNGQR